MIPVSQPEPTLDAHTTDTVLAISALVATNNTGTSTTNNTAENVAATVLAGMVSLGLSSLMSF